MEFNRFVQYAKYDLTINKAFYRNTSIVTASIITGMAIIGFLYRWLMIHEIKSYIENPLDLPDDSFTVRGTVIMISITATIMLYIFAGCFNHPLRNKQGRISTLTLPATNGEKFVWHTLVTIVGGYLLCMISIIAADLVNALFSLIAGFPTSQIHSISKPFLTFNFLHVDSTDLFMSTTKIYALIGLAVASGFWIQSMFVFVNSMKYRYNILWTIVVLWVLQFLLNFLFFFGMLFVFDNKFIDSLNSMEEDMDINGWFWGIYWFNMFIVVGTAALMWWKSWRNYKNAQITNKWNRI